MTSKAEKHFLRFDLQLVAGVGQRICRGCGVAVEVEAEIFPLDERRPTDPYTLEEPAPEPPEDGVPRNAADLRHVGRP